MKWLRATGIAATSLAITSSSYAGDLAAAFTGKSVDIEDFATGFGIIIAGLCAIWPARKIIGMFNAS